MLAGFARRSDCRLKERGRSRALGRSDTACRFVGRWITFRRTEGEPVHGELLICAHFLHFLESLSGCCHARFSKSEEGPRDRFGVSVGRTLRITGWQKLFRSEIHGERSFGTSLLGYGVPPSEFATAAQQTLP